MLSFPTELSKKFVEDTFNPLFIELESTYRSITLETSFNPLFIESLAAQTFLTLLSAAFQSSFHRAIMSDDEKAQKLIDFQSSFHRVVCETLTINQLMLNFQSSFHRAVVLHFTIAVLVWSLSILFSSSIHGNWNDYYV